MRLTYVNERVHEIEHGRAQRSLGLQRAQARRQWRGRARAGRDDLERGAELVVRIVGGRVEQSRDLRAVAPELLAERLLEARGHPDLGAEPIAREGHRRELVGECEPEVVHQAIDPAQREPPRCIGAGVALEALEDAERAVTVGAKPRLGELDPALAAVAFDLALVGVEHDLPHEAAVAGRRELRVEQRQELGGEHGRIAAEAQPQVPVRIAVPRKNHCSASPRSSAVVIAGAR